MTERMVSVRNRNNGFTGYSIMDKGIRRQFAPGETKKISIEELKELQYQPGGEEMLANYLIVEDAEALKELNMEVEPEYNLSETEIKELLLNGSLDQLEDFLNFAPDGAIEICKQYAVVTEVPDTRKRDLISKMTGFNVDSAIKLNKMLDEDNTGKEEAPKKVRKVPVEQNKVERKVTTPNYKVVSK